jgi:hypothetical protein
MNVKKRKKECVSEKVRVGIQHYSNGERASPLENCIGINLIHDSVTQFNQLY